VTHIPLSRPPVDDDVYHLYVVRTSRRTELADFLKQRGVQTGVHYPVPAHRQPAVAHLAPPSLPETERLVDEILTLPLSACHTEAEIDQVAEAVRAFFGR
jgi:dTDP-4-amino-4,6-dideoxygalactose transaminase